MTLRLELRRLGCALAALSAIAFAAPAMAQASPAPSAAEAQAADARYRALAAQEAARAGDPAFDYELGIAAADSGRFGAAIIAFQRVLAVRPDHAQARAELARAYAMAGDVDTARAQFATVIDDPTLPDPVRQRFTGFVRGLDRRIQGGGSDVSGFAEAALGHDSNINAATDLASITIPLFAALGPGTLGAGARAQEDQYYELSGGISGVTAISRQDRLFASVLGNWRDNFDSAGFDQASLTGTVGIAHSFANQDVISVSAQAQGYWLGHDPYRTAIGLIGQYTHRLAGGRALTVSAQWNRLDYDADPLRDADRFALGVGLVTRHVSASLSAGHEESRDPAGDANSSTFAGASIGAEVPVTAGVALVAGAAFELRRHDAADAMFLVERADERLDISAGAKIAILPALYLQPRLTWSRNWSNVPLYDHERWTAAAAVRFEF